MIDSHILVVDDNKSVLSTLEYLLAGKVNTIYGLTTPNRIPEYLNSNDVDVIILDMNFSAGVNTGNEGLYWLDRIIKDSPQIIVIMITAYGEVDLAVKAIKMGASDFIVKPWDNQRIVDTISSAIRLRNSKKDLSVRDHRNIHGDKAAGQYIVGTSEGSVQMMKAVEKVAGTDANILITGENGTGKEMLAREIHAQSNRKSEAFVAIDLGSIPESLFESELFGHKKGAFTDARTDRKGKFEAAQRGTLFLDEVGNMSVYQQQKLLSAIQNRMISPLGSARSIEIDVRLICATNIDLKAAVKNGRFREDLFFRINTIPIEIPPLRDRKEDIPHFVYYFLNRYARKYNRESLDISKPALDKIINHKWPGNIRELDHALEKAVIMSDGQQLMQEDFTLVDFGGHLSINGNQTLEEMERMMIISALKSHQGNVSAVAKQLGITRQTLYNKMSRHGL